MVANGLIIFGTVSNPVANQESLIPWPIQAPIPKDWDLWNSQVYHLIIKCKMCFWAYHMFGQTHMFLQPQWLTALSWWSQVFEQHICIIGTRGPAPLLLFQCRIAFCTIQNLLILNISVSVAEKARIQLLAASRVLAYLPDLALPAPTARTAYLPRPRVFGTKPLQMFEGLVVLATDGKPGNHGWERWLIMVNNG